MPYKFYYKQMSKWRSICITKEYEAHKFQISGIFPVSQNKKNNTAIEFDCVMLKQ